MKLVSDPVTILDRSPYGADVVWPRSGAQIEALKVLDASGAIFENLTLDPDLGDVKLTAGQRVRLVLNLVREQVVRRAASGREYVGSKDKYRVLGVEPA